MIVKMKSLQGAQPFPCEWPRRLAASSRSPRTCQRLFEPSTKPLVICLPRRYPLGHSSCGHQPIPWTAAVNPPPAVSRAPWQAYRTGWRAFPQIWVSRCLYSRHQKKRHCQSHSLYSDLLTSFRYSGWMTGPLCVAFASASGAVVALPPALDSPETDVEAVTQKQPPLLLVPTSAPQSPIYHNVGGSDLVLPFVAGQVLALVDSPHELQHYCCDRGLPH